MKLFALAILAAAPTASAFQVGAVQPRASSTSTILDMSSMHTTHSIHDLGEVRHEDIYSALNSLEGPSICYGHFAVLDNKRELDIKEYDNFDAFRCALDQADLTKLLKMKGPYTVLAPTNSAIDNFDGVLTEELLKAHIIEGDMLLTDRMEGTHETMNGSTVTFRREFRKTYIDNAQIGQFDNHSGGTPYPTNSMCENGVIHAINVVLIPSWTRSAADSQGVQGLSLQSHLKQDVLKDRGALPDDATDKH